MQHRKATIRMKKRMIILFVFIMLRCFELMRLKIFVISCTCQTTKIAFLIETSKQKGCKCIINEKEWKSLGDSEFRLYIRQFEYKLRL